MLVLTRKLGESIKINDDITITVVQIKGKQVRVGIDAPKETKVHREEIYESIKKQNMEASMTSIDSVRKLNKILKKA